MALFSDYLSLVLSMPKISKFLEEMKSSTDLVFFLSTKRGRETKKIIPEIDTKQKISPYAKE